MRTEYTMTSKKRYLVKHVCSECGSPNLHVHTVNESVKASSGGFVTEKREQKLNAQMSEALKKNMESRLNQIAEEEKNKNYYSAKYKVRCDKCHHREPWAKYFYTDFFKNISYLMTIPAFIKGFLLVDDGRMDHLVYYLMIVFALIGLSYLIKYLRKKSLDKKVEALPPESLPVIIDIK